MSSNNMHFVDTVIVDEVVLDYPDFSNESNSHLVPGTQAIMEDNLLALSTELFSNKMDATTTNNNNIARYSMESIDMADLWKCVGLDGTAGPAEVSEVAEVPDFNNMNQNNIHITIAKPSNKKSMKPKKSAQKKNSKSTNSAGKTNRQASLKLSKVIKDAANLPLAALVPAGELPLDHRPARGRGRLNQLKQMTPQQRKAEAAARAEKNRQAARDFRLRRKYHVQELEDKVSALEEKDKVQSTRINELEAELEQLRSLIGFNEHN